MSVDAKTRADDLLAEAEVRRATGRIDEAIPLYREAASLYPPYASIELVAADSLFELGRYREAADAYGRVTDAVPEHEQAWLGRSNSLHLLGRHDEGSAMLARHDALESALVREDSSEAVGRYEMASTMDQRAASVTTMLRSLDDGVAEALHDFLVRAHDDPVGIDHDHLPLLASILVRFGIADFVHWYADGPAPNREWIRADVAKYLAANRRPPPIDRQQPIWGSPPPESVRRRDQTAHPRRVGARWLGRLFRR